jgi:hypothetical protein
MSAMIDPATLKTQLEAMQNAASVLQGQVNDLVVKHSEMVAALAAEAAKVPTIEDLQALVGQMAASQAHT